MPLRDRIVWGAANPFSDPRLADLPELVKRFKRGCLPSEWRSRTFENRDNDLPQRDAGHYREFYIGPPNVSGSLRVVLGKGSEVFVTGNHYRDFRQVFGLPA